MFESEPDEEEENDWEYDGDDDDADDIDDDEPTSRRPRSTKEEDLYCRVGDCLWAFKDSRMCTKHRLRHFSESASWICPGPCRGTAQESATFTRSDTLKRHLVQNNAACLEAVLKVLKLDTIPRQGSAWLVPFRVGLERPWESPDYQLTDLSIVKDVKMKLRSSGDAELPDPDMHTNRRRRYK